MKFFLAEGIEIELTPEIEKNVIMINDVQFKHNNKTYSVKPIEFKIDDIYFLLYEMVKNNPGKKIFVHHFEQLANGFYAMYFAMEE